MKYQPRVVDRLLDEVFGDLAAIAIEGAKGVGKTATATQRVQTVLALNQQASREIVKANPGVVSQLPPPVLIDEWQLEPQVWEEVRAQVDRNSAGGQFLLAGSASPEPGVRIHSGAGRIVRMVMRPMTFSERGVYQPEVSFKLILGGEKPAVEGRSEVELADYTSEILRSGFPGIRQLPQRARELQLDGYLARIVDHELVENAIEVRRPAALRAWLTAYAAATSTDAAYTTILDAATPGEGSKPARQTADIYRDHLSRIFILDPLPAWTPTFSPLKRLTKTPKHHLVDPALAARLVGVGQTGLLLGQGGRVNPATGTWLGALFESLVTQAVRVYAEAAGANTFHLRTQSTEREIDLIVERADLGVVAIEVKLVSAINDADVRHLNWLQDQLGERVVDKIVINTGEFAYRRDDGVAVIPLALLGP